MLCGCFSFVLRLAVTNRINDRGVRIDTELVQEAITCDLMLSDAMSKKAYELTGLENPNSVSQLKTWLEERGIPMDTLGKKDVAQMITELDKNGVDAEALDMLKLRLQMAKSSVKKYQAAERCVCSDGRARGLFQFYGASRTGRYSGRNIQLQNLPQNHISTLDEARTLVKLGCFDMVESIYGNTPDVLSQLIRTMLIPKDGCEFIVADFSAIEARMLAWEAEEQWVLDAFQNGEDLYCATASQMFHVPVVKHGVNGDLRQKGKIATLACGYGGSSGALISMGALQMGLHEEELPEIIDSWREANPKIVQYWWDIMYGYATNETAEQMPIPYMVATKFLQLLKAHPSKMFRADAKAQVSYDYDTGRITTFLCSVQHSPDVEVGDFRHIIESMMVMAACEYGLDGDFTKLVNPTGRFVLGGSYADCGVTGRKLACDTYGGIGRMGGGALSGKDPTKVDRSAAYMARKIAKDIVQAGYADKCEVQLAYAIGVVQPVGVSVECFGTEHQSLDFIEAYVHDRYDLTTQGICKKAGVQLFFYGGNNYNRVNKR